jgi:hypothetical protein
MDELPTEKTDDWTEAKLVATAVEDQEWLAIKEESLFSNETFFARKYNDLSDEDKQEKGSLKVEEKEHEGVWTYFHIIITLYSLQLYFYLFITILGICFISLVSSLYIYHHITP